MAQSNQSASCFTWKSISYIFHIFRPVNCNQDLQVKRIIIISARFRESTQTAVSHTSCDHRASVTWKLKSRTDAI